MKSKKSTLKIIMSRFLLMLFLIFGLSTTVLAQSNFNPPTLLPGDNTNIGGYGDACIGLATMIRTGEITLRQIPCFIKFFSEVFIIIAGSISVIFVMIGGYKYVLGSDASKDDAKKTIMYALIGLAVSLSAWFIVDIVLQLATES